MRDATPEQRAVLESPARVRVVRAVPGSGKTWLVAEAIRQEIEAWRRPMCGIAAISFTRVGGREIRRALGHDLVHPHFVGTIDAFLFRYVIRPHLRQAFPGSFADLHLLPGDCGAEHWGKLGGGIKAVAGKGIKVLACVATGEDAQGRAILAHKRHPAGPLCEITGADLEAVRQVKRKIWRTRGFLTHSDVALWASKLLVDPYRGPSLRREIISRFAVFIVDELQDTGYFLAKSIKALLTERSVCGLVVGDPDQAIYEFTGARPDLFASFEMLPDTDCLPLSASRRCPPAILAAAVHLKESGGEVASSAGRPGRAFLIRYANLVPDVVGLANAFQAASPGGAVRVVSRGSATVQELSGHSFKDGPSLHCRPLTHLHRAVNQFRRGNRKAALATMRAAVARAVFDTESVTDEGLRDRDVVPSAWNALAIRCLLAANELPTSCTLFDWQREAASLLDREILALRLGSLATYAPGKLKPEKRSGWNGPAFEPLRLIDSGAESVGSCHAQTVHSVKGETHDCTIVVCPPANSVQKCPSVKWWADDPSSQEERRIAYVAMTRSCVDLAVCVTQESYDRLLTRRPAFVATFRCMAVSECIDLLRRPKV